MKMHRSKFGISLAIIYFVVTAYTGYVTLTCDGFLCGLEFGVLTQPWSSYTGYIGGRIEWLLFFAAMAINTYFYIIRTYAFGVIARSVATKQSSFLVKTYQILDCFALLAMTKTSSNA